ncbi:hypothetical protein SLEP1_g6726 [Rubroshorea leprosula]|uniref:Uncharacterized protein n=1 Tax=Rubroshorea leprosula TaxID=152421 RepID=A0AAV5HW51_9ROSI|nr:hypothetical protein SLEP1_g6726 [Rubroshorea leprosula]
MIFSLYLSSCFLIPSFDDLSYSLQLSVRNCFIRGSVARYVQLPPEGVDVELLHDATRREAQAVEIVRSTSSLSAHYNEHQNIYIKCLCLLQFFLQTKPYLDIADYCLPYDNLMKKMFIQTVPINQYLSYLGCMINSFNLGNS